MLPAIRVGASASFLVNALHWPTYTLEFLVVVLPEVKVLAVLGLAQMPQLPPLLQCPQREQLAQALQGLLP